MKISAVIFDLDGTIVNDDHVYQWAFEKVIADLGIKQKNPIPIIGGIGVKNEWQNFIAKLKIKTDKNLDELAVLTQQAYLSKLDGLKLRPGVEAFIDSLKAKNIPLALATSNNWGVVDKILFKFGLENVFDAVTTAEEVIFLKPDPDLFLLSALKLGVEPEECLVIEDRPTGVKAAKGAGMKVAVLAKDQQKSKFQEADFTFSDFDELATIIGLVEKSGKVNLS